MNSAIKLTFTVLHALWTKMLAYNLHPLGSEPQLYYTIRYMLHDKHTNIYMLRAFIIFTISTLAGFDKNKMTRRFCSEIPADPISTYQFFDCIYSIIFTSSIDNYTHSVWPCTHKKEIQHSNHIDNNNNRK